MNNPKPPQSQPELRSCPFCGCEATLHYYLVCCENKYCIQPTTGSCSSQQDAIKAWNQRSASNNPLVVEVVIEALEKAKRGFSDLADKARISSPILVSLAANDYFKYIKKALKEINEQE